MHACDFNIFPMAKNRKDQEIKGKQRLEYLKTLSHTSPQNLHHTYLHIKMLFQVYCICHVFTFKIFLFIVQFEAHGKVAVYSGVHLYKLHICHFISWG
jgi:hypothetical protein